MDVKSLAMGYASSSAETAADCDLLTNDGPLHPDIDDEVRREIVSIADRMQCIDLRGVVIVEFWAMMSGALPFGWREYAESHGYCALGPEGSGCRVPKKTDGETWLDAVLRLSSAAWAAEYAARPRLEE